MEESVITVPADARVIMMCGVSGAGKTYIARRLESEGFVRLSADSLVWDELGPAYSSMPPAMQSAIYMAAIDNLVASIPQRIAVGERLVIDASMCKRRRRDAVVELCRSIGVKSVILYVDAPRSVLAGRLAMRGGKGPDDQLVPESDLDRFLHNFESPEPDENFIHIKYSTPTTSV